MGFLRLRAAALSPLAVLAAVLCLSIEPARAADKYAGEFLRVGAGARAVGMGGAFSAVADDGTASMWNPAGLSYLTYREVYFQHAALFGNQVQYDYGSFVLPLSKSGDRRQAIAVSLVRLGVDDIPVTGTADQLEAGTDYEDENSNGSWDPGERLFLSPDQFQLESANDWGLLFSYSRPFGSRLAVGGNLKMIYRTLPGNFNESGNSAYGAGLDAGLTYQATDRVTLAFVAKDFTSTIMVWNTDSRERISPNFVMGGQFTTPLGQLHMITFALDVPFNFDGSTVDQRFGTSNGQSGLSGTFNVGAEYWYHNTLALRTGLMSRDLTFGAGIRHKRIGADYAAVFNRFFSTEAVDFQGDSDLDVTHRISGSYNF